MAGKGEGRKVHAVEAPGYLTLRQPDRTSTSNHCEHNYGECRVMITTFYRVTLVFPSFFSPPRFVDLIPRCEEKTRDEIRKRKKKSRRSAEIKTDTGEKKRSFYDFVR